MLIAVFDEEVVDCFLPCFPLYSQHRQLEAWIDSLLAHEGSEDLIIGRATPKSL